MDRDEVWTFNNMNPPSAGKGDAMKTRLGLFLFLVGTVCGSFAATQSEAAFRFIVAGSMFAVITILAQIRERLPERQ